MWAVEPPAIYHLLFPVPVSESSDQASQQADQSSKPVVEARFFPLNGTTVTPTEIAELSTQERYVDKEPYTGWFQPWEGVLAQFGLNVPVAYVVFYASKMPNWVPLMLASVLSRNMM